jgi:hypothetical protein
MPAPKKATKAAAPKAPPAEDEKPNIAADNGETGTPPEADEAAGQDGSLPAIAEGSDPGDEPDDDGEEEFEVPQTGSVDVPCRVCFPDGWPAEEQGAFVNCAHDFGIRYGEQVEITRERAVELGFLEAEPA